MTADPADAGPPDPGPAVRSRGSYALLVAAGILLSRVAGLIRERVIAHYLGNSLTNSAFRAGLRIPNALQNLFGEGVLSASFIPVYSKLLAEGDEKLAGRVAGVFVTILSFVVAVIVLLGVLLTPFLVLLIAPGFQGEARALTIRIVRILFPGMGLLVLSAWCLGVLNSHRKFFLSYVAPVLWNAAMIATLVALGSRLSQPSLAVALAWGTVVGCALQLLVQLPFVFRYAKSLRFAFDTTLAPVREIFRNMGPVIFGRGVVQFSAFVDQMIASFLGVIAFGGLGFAYTIYLLPISLFGMSVAAAELPQMSSATGTSGQIADALRARLQRGLRQIAFLVIPTSVAFVLIGRFLVAALYQTGRFGAADTLYVWYILCGFSVGLLAVTLARLYSSAFYALRDTRTPLRFAMIRVAVGAVAGALLAFPLRPLIVLLMNALGMNLPAVEQASVSIGAVGLSLGAGAASWIEFLLLRRTMWRRVGKPESSARFYTTVWIASLVSGIAAWATGAWITSYFFPVTAPGRSIEHLLGAGLVCLVFGVIYISMALVLRIEESRSLLRRLKRS